MTHDEREAYQGDEQDYRHKQSLRTAAATSHNEEYEMSAAMWRALRALQQGNRVRGGRHLKKLYDMGCIEYTASGTFTATRKGIAKLEFQPRCDDCGRMFT